MCGFGADAAAASEAEVCDPKIEWLSFSRHVGLGSE